MSLICRYLMIALVGLVIETVQAATISPPDDTEGKTRTLLVQNSKDNAAAASARGSWIFQGITGVKKWIKGQQVEEPVVGYKEGIKIQRDFYLSFNKLKELMVSPFAEQDDPCRLAIRLLRLLQDTETTCGKDYYKDALEVITSDPELKTPALSEVREILISPRKRQHFLSQYGKGKGRAYIERIPPAPRLSRRSSTSSRYLRNLMPSISFVLFATTIKALYGSSYLPGVRGDHTSSIEGPSIAFRALDERTGAYPVLEPPRYLPNGVLNQRPCIPEYGVLIFTGDETVKPRQLIQAQDWDPHQKLTYSITNRQGNPLTPVNGLYTSPLGAKFTFDQNTAIITYRYLPKIEYQEVIYYTASDGLEASNVARVFLVHSKGKTPIRFNSSTPIIYSGYRDDL